MRTREEVTAYCQTFPDAYVDYPFHDDNWAVMRCRRNKKCFVFLCDREGAVWVSVKCNPEWITFWREAFDSVIPGFHLNKKYWNTIILDGTVPEEDVKRMIGESYDLVSAAR